MSSLTLSMILHASILASTSHDYGEALKIADTTGRPMVILVGADWCPGCVVMKHQTMPQLKESGKMKDVVYATVDADAQQGLANGLMQGGAIPQLVIYRKTPAGWRRSRLIGSQTEEDVAAFIRRAVKRQQSQRTGGQQASMKVKG